MNRLQKIFADATGFAGSDDNLLASTIYNISEWDSLTHVNIMLMIEKEYNVIFNNNEVTELISVKLIIENLKSKGKL